MKTTWTQADEAALDEMIARKQRAYAESRRPLLDLLEAPNSPYWRDTDTDEIMKWMIDNADAIRDALQPFDSGVRPAKPGV